MGAGSISGVLAASQVKQRTVRRRGLFRVQPRKGLRSCDQLGIPPGAPSRARRAWTSSVAASSVTAPVTFSAAVEKRGPACGVRGRNSALAEHGSRFGAWRRVVIAEPTGPAASLRFWLGSLQTPYELGSKRSSVGSRCLDRRPVPDRERLRFTAVQGARMPLEAGP